VIIEGLATGADTLAGLVARELGCRLETFPAQWEIYGGAAGNIRNTQMLNVGIPDRVEAFHDHITSSRGTADMIKQALKAGLPVVLHHATRSARVLWIRVPSKKSGKPVEIGLE
jgi:hypothetical protein